MNPFLKLLLLISVFYLKTISCHRANKVEKEASKQFPSINENLASEEVYTCPNASLIAPCYCYTSGIYPMSMVCSMVTSDEELRSVFNQTFPSYEFYDLTISVNSDLTALSDGVFGNSTFEEIYFEKVFKLTTIESEIFEKMEQTLEKITFKECSLLEFIFDFSNFENLDWIYLQNNSISSFDVNSPTVVFVYLEYNLLTQDTFTADLPNVEILYLSSNNFEMIPDISNFTSLRELNLFSNSLTTVLPDAICHSEYLTMVNFFDNYVSNVGMNSICVTNGSIVSFWSNEITTLEENIYRPIAENVTEQGLWLQDNPLECGCDIAWIVSDVMLDKFNNETTCINGTLLIDLDPDYYEVNC